MLTLTTTDGFLDVMDQVPGLGDDAAVRARSEHVEWDGLAFDVVSLDALITAKRAAARSKDLSHLRELDAIRPLEGGKE